VAKLKRLKRHVLKSPGQGAFFGESGPKKETFQMKRRKRKMTDRFNVEGEVFPPKRAGGKQGQSRITAVVRKETSGGTSEADRPSSYHLDYLTHILK